MRWSAWLGVFFLLLLVSPVFAVLDHGQMNIYAVSEGDGGGVVASLLLDIKPGTGRIFTSVEPLVGTATQTTERTAVSVASRFFPKTKQYDYFFTIRSDRVSEVDGPSAGAAMTLLVTSMVLDKPLPSYVAITGTITPEGFVGPIGGVYAKARKASQTGIKLFMIPQGEAVQTVKLADGVKKVNLVDFGPKEMGLKIVEVRNIEQVMNYAFSSIESIDVNASDSNSLPVFVPKPIPLNPVVAPFKEVTQEELRGAQRELGLAKKAISGTLIEDSGTLAFLFELLDNAEETFQQAQALSESNYLYSAANFAFLAKINALTVKEIAMNPGLLNENSSELDSRIKDLEGSMAQLERDLNVLTQENLEWNITAQQRFMYAKTLLAKLKSTRTVVVGGDRYDSQSVQLKRVQDYFFVQEWLEISRQFYAHIPFRDSVRVQGTTAFDSVSEKFLSGAQELIAGQSEDQTEDIARRIAAAQAGMAEGWNLAALMDSASAYALALGDSSFQELDSNELHAALVKRVQELDQNLAASPPSLWAQMYRDHAHYYLLSGEFFQEKGYGASAISAFRNGLTIALMAEQVHSVSQAVSAYYADHPELQVVSSARSTVPGKAAGTPDYSFSWLSILALVLVVGAVGIALFQAHFRRPNVEKELAGVESALNALDIDFVHKRVSPQEYESRRKTLTDKRMHLAELHREHLQKVLTYDSLGASQISLQSRLHALRQHYSDGLVSREEYAAQKKSLEKGLHALTAKKDGFSVKAADSMNAAMEEVRPSARSKPRKKTVSKSSQDIERVAFNALRKSRATAKARKGKNS
ncbi:MAG: hypothetical protein HY917_00155 [Candidatus Diapherotrites archaeon]|nr:hypothetical protein [Candidatus Diapherotrites archaeon]